MKILKILGSVLAIVIVQGCVEEESNLSSENDGYTYIADCDRHLRKGPTKNGLQYWSLSNIGCMLYKGGGVDKPASIPTTRKQFLFFASGDAQRPTKCDLSESNKKLHAKCEGTNESRLVGTVRPNGRVDMNDYYAFNIVIWDTNQFRRWSHKADGIEALEKATEIGFTRKKAQVEQ